MGQDNNGRRTILNFDTGTMDAVAVDNNNNFQFTSGKTSRSLKTLLSQAPAIPVPAVRSGRIYFAINNDFPDGSMPVSGPSASQGTATLFDKLEFDTSGAPNINTTGVDFYGISMTLSVPDRNGNIVTAGYDCKRSDVFSAVSKNAGDNGSDIANPGIFARCVIASGTMGFSDWGDTEEDRVKWARRCSHFLDSYITGLCWKKGRTFSFHDKLFPAGNVVFGSVDDTGQWIQLFDDEARTIPHAVPSLPRPAGRILSPDVSEKIYHHVDGATADDIDWGFLLLGNSMGAGFAKEWSDDPAVIAILTAICRGVMHLDEVDAWLPQPRQGSGATNYYNATGAPVYLYAKILHDLGVNRFAYALSFDDVYAQNTSLFFDRGSQVTIRLHSLGRVAAPGASSASA
jgi:hypothetical protein